MISEKKLAANRLNARKSTGPRTAEGKARSSRNASTHGIFCRDLVLAGENEEEFILLREQFIAALVPQDIMELTLVDEIVAAKWKLKRVQSAEGFLHASKADELGRLRDEEIEELKRQIEDPYREEEVDKLTERQRALASLAEGDVTAAVSLSMMCVDPEDRMFDRLTQYEQRLQNSIHRCLRDLKQMRKDREKDLRPSIYAMDSERLDVGEPRRRKGTKEVREDQTTSTEKASILENEPTRARGEGLSQVILTSPKEKHGLKTRATGAVHGREARIGGWKRDAS